MVNTLLRDMPLFVEVAKQKSFSKAAENMEMYVSTLSRRIAGLESDLGVPLFLRNTRNVELTEGGKTLLERCEYILAETESAREAVVGNMAGLAGPVRLSIPEYSYHALLRGAFSRFAAMWPDIRLSINFNEHPVDLMTEPYDIDFRAGPLEDSTLKARKILRIEPCMYASPRLFESYPLPEKPDDLRSVPCICFSRIGPVWIMEKGRQRASVPVNVRHSFGSVFLCYEFALAGHGVAMVRRPLGIDDEKSGKLIRVLPEWTGPCHDMYLVTAGGQTPRRIRVFIDFLAEHFATAPQ